MSRSKLYENGPEIVEKKYTVAHARNSQKKLVRYFRGAMCGVFRYILNYNLLLRHRRKCFGT